MKNISRNYFYYVGDYKESRKSHGIQSLGTGPCENARDSLLFFIDHFWSVYSFEKINNN